MSLLSAYDAYEDAGYGRESRIPGPRLLPTPLGASSHPSSTDTMGTRVANPEYIDSQRVTVTNLSRLSSGRGLYLSSSHGHGLV